MVRSHTHIVLATIVIMSVPGIETHSLAQHPTPTTPQIVKNEVLVKYASAVIPPTGEALKYKIIAKYPSGVVRYKLPPHESVESAITKLKMDTNVLRARPNYRIYGHAHNADPPNDRAWFTHSLWGLEVIQMKEAWDLSNGGIRGDDIIIAVLDTGIDHNHPDLNLNRWSGIGKTFIDPNYNVCDLKPQPSDSMDHDGHGTHVAGIVAARGHNNWGQDDATSLVGVNWEAKLMAVKIMCNDFPSGTIVDAVEGIHYAIANNATVIVGPWGFPAAGLPAADIDDLRNAITRARAKDILYVASAGNNYVDLSDLVMYPQHFPFDNVIVVAATTPTEQLWVENALGTGSNYGPKVHIAAPGKNILGAWPVSTRPSGGYTSTNSGTSLAAPHVAGCAALLQAKRKKTHPTSPLSPADLKDILLTSADSKGPLKAWIPSGRRLNCNMALKELARRSPSSSNPTAPASPTNLRIQ